MALFLQIVGGLFVALVLAAVAAWFWLKWKLRKVAGEFGEALAEWAEYGPLPSRVQLERADDVEWRDAAAVGAIAEGLRELGYVECGTFRHGPMPVLGLAHRAERIYALVAEHPQSGAFLDLATGYEEGGWFTVTTCPDNGLDRPDDMPIRRFECGTPEDLHRALIAEREDGPFVKTPADGFVATVAFYSEEELLWRVRRGGPSTDEIRRVAALSGQDVTDEQVEQTREQMRTSLLWEAVEVLKDRFLDASMIGARDWEEMRESVLFVHDALEPEEVVERIECEIDWPDDGAEERFAVTAKRIAESKAAREAFAAIAECRPGGQEFEKIGSVEGTLPADVYRVVPKFGAVAA